MATPLNIGTKDIPLRLAEKITARVKSEWESGAMLTQCTPITQDLLKFWFNEPHTDNRHFNFHIGQKQAILNVIYLHEILKTKSVIEIYENIYPDLLAGQISLAELKKPKYEIPKYAVKMATGTGKTWVMHALLIWQYLNAKYEEQKTGRYTKNFLLITPGLIVYERLLDAYLGKENEQEQRDFEKSDFFQFNGLFLPPNYKDDIFGFVQSSVATKDEIGKKVTADGLIAITNWHLFLDREKEQEVEVTPLENTAEIVKDIFPLTPGVSGGNELNALDNAYLAGNEIEFLRQLNDLMVVNDEAHHIHENKSYGEIQEVEWQKSLNVIAENKESQFIQIDFSATPYDTTGSGQNRTQHFFPHIVIDFDLRTAIHKGLVKTIAIDKRKEITETTLDFKAIRDGNRVVALSDGQKLMLRAAIKKLKILGEHFVKLKDDKHPKMMVICEDTNVSPFVKDFLIEEGMTEDEVTQIDSGKKEFLSEKEWGQVKNKLFNIDKYDKPKVIVSVLMLREGFDVNNICVIVPLRASSAPILLEQTIGRGLRLMWREPEYQSIKEENRRKLLVEKKEPINYIDLLSIIEHPEFIQFYDRLFKELVGETTTDPTTTTGVIGDIITVGLKENYQDYDLYFPIIIKEKEEELKESDFSIEKLETFTLFELVKLKNYLGKDGEKFFGEEITVKTRFGEYLVTANLFTAQSYNEYLEKLLHTVTNRIEKVSARKTKSFPTIQINQLHIVSLIDHYIRTKLFNQSFNPFEDNNWKVLLLRNGIVTQHIVKEIGKLIFDMQNNVEVSNAKVEKRFFSEVTKLKMRESYSLPLTKTIYERLPFPSNKGEFEMNFMLYADSDAGVESFIKINEYYHTFAHIIYIRIDGLLASYYPDFILKTKDKIYLVETKATKDLQDPNVKQKQLATLNWIKKRNELNPEDRMEREWKYILLGEKHFYGLRDNGASIEEILTLAEISEANVTGQMF